MRKRTRYGKSKTKQKDSVKENDLFISLDPPVNAIDPPVKAEKGTADYAIRVRVGRKCTFLRAKKYAMFLAKKRNLNVYTAKRVTKDDESNSLHKTSNKDCNEKKSSKRRNDLK